MLESSQRKEEKKFPSSIIIVDNLNAFFWTTLFLIASAPQNGNMMPHICVSVFRSHVHGDDEK